MPCTVESKCHACGQMADPSNKSVPLWEAVRDMENRFIALREHHLEMEKKYEEQEVWKDRHDQVVAQRNRLKYTVNELEQRVEALDLQVRSRDAIALEENLLTATKEQLVEALAAKYKETE